MVNQSGSPSNPSLLNLEEGLKEELTEGAMHMANISTILMEGSFHQISAEDTLQIEDILDLDDLSENLTKVLIQCPRVSGNSFNKDKIHCFECKEFGHMQNDCPELNKPCKEDHPGP